MTRLHTYATAAAATLLLAATDALAQRPTASVRRPAAAAPAGDVPAGATGAAAAQAPNPNVSVVALHLDRRAVDAVSEQLRAADGARAKRSLLERTLRTTLTGDEHRRDAANRTLTQMAQGLGAGTRTVIVVIGTVDDRDRVVASLASVRRPVAVAFVDRDHADAATDNTVLGGGIVGSVTDGIKNLWVFLPQPGASPRERPDHTLSTHVAAETLWNGLFAMDGDELDLDQLRRARSDSGATTHATPE